MAEYVNSSKNQFELHAIVWGQVQGVGFRVTTCHYASKLNLQGTVRNLDDGNVEIYAQGSREKLEELIRLLRAHFGKENISSIDTSFTTPTTLYKGFIVI